MLPWLYKLCAWHSLVVVRHFGLLHHSDRGSTYTSESYQELLEQEGMRVSMSRTADCYDNAAMESFFHSFKGECIDGQPFQTRAQERRQRL